MSKAIYKYLALKKDYRKVEHFSKRKLSLLQTDDVTKEKVCALGLLRTPGRRKEKVNARRETWRLEGFMAEIGEKKCQTNFLS